MMICSAFKKNADAKPQLSGSFFASRHAGTRRLGDPQSAKSRRRETLFSGAGRLGLRAVAAVGARGSVPPVEAAVAAAPTSDPVVSAASAAPATPSRSWRPPQPHRSRSGRSLRRPCAFNSGVGTGHGAAAENGPRPAPAAENYAHLFAAKSAEPVAKNKDQPLKSLLERIATCR